MAFKSLDTALIEQQMAGIEIVCRRMSRNSPTTIKPSGRRECQIDSNMLNRLRSGERYTVSDWYKLLDLLLTAKAVRTVVFIGPASILPAPKDNEIGIWIREVTSTNGLPQWCFTIYQSPDRKVKTFVVRETNSKRVGLWPVAAAFKVLPYTLLYSYHQETATVDGGHHHHQDAILVKMLSGILDKDFDPHRLRTVDGVNTTLEILRNLEQMQKETEVTAIMSPSMYM